MVDSVLREGGLRGCTCFVAEKHFRGEDLVDGIAARRVLAAIIHESGMDGWTDGWMNGWMEREITVTMGWVRNRANNRVRNGVMMGLIRNWTTGKEVVVVSQIQCRVIFTYAFPSTAVSLPQ